MNKPTPQPNIVERILGELLEKCADIEHERWSKWQKWVHSIGTKNYDGSITLKKDDVFRWERQMNTPYEKLSEKEKESDRHQVQVYLPLVRLSMIRAIRESFAAAEKPFSKDIFTHYTRDAVMEILKETQSALLKSLEG